VSLESQKWGEYRLHWLLSGIACAILAGCILVIGLIIVGTANNCRDEMTEHIGSFDSKEAGVRAAIPKLAIEISRCPNAEVYRVMWVGPGNYPGNYRHAIMYSEGIRG